MRDAHAAVALGVGNVGEQAVFKAADEACVVEAVAEREAKQQPQERQNGNAHEYLSDERDAVLQANQPRLEQRQPWQQRVKEEQYAVTTRAARAAK